MDVLMQSIGFNPEMFRRRGKLLALIRLVPYCERNYNLIELGPKGTGKSHIYRGIFAARDSDLRRGSERRKAVRQQLLAARSGSLATGIASASTSSPARTRRWTRRWWTS